MHKPFVVVLIGPPGSGKGTQAAILAQQHGLQVFTMSNFLREQSHKGSTEGEVLASYMKLGELVPDGLVFKLITAELKSIVAPGGVVFDGFPREVAQALFLESQIAVTHVIHFVVPREVSIQRIAGRRLCPRGHQFNIYYVKPKVTGRCDFDGAPLVQREDDMPSIVATRLANDAEMTVPLLDFYRSSGVLYSINGDASIPTVAVSIEHILFDDDRKR